MKCFYNFAQVNLKGNLLENISDHAFWGLEETLMEIDLSENKLKTFPYSPLRQLRLLSSLNLVSNFCNLCAETLTSKTHKHQLGFLFRLMPVKP